MTRIVYLFQNLLRRPSVRWLLGALLIYTATTLILMYPVPFHLSTMIAGHERGDAYQYTWSLWWAKQAVLDPDKGLAHLTLMNHPVGIEHPFMLTLVGVNLIALPFSLLLPPAAVYNLQILLSFVLSGLAMYWLCTELTGDRRAGLVGGFIFAFFLNKTGHAVGGHLPQVTVYWLPIYVLFLWRTVSRPGWGSALVASLALVFTCLIHVIHIVYFILPVTVVVLLVALVKLGMTFFTWRRLAALLLAFGLAALVAGSLLLPTVLSSLADDSYLYKVGTVDHSIDLLSFFTPSPYHPVLSPLGWVPSFANKIFYDQEALYERLAYPGVLAMGLALWGLIRQRRKAWIWGVLAALTALLSLGPLLKVGDRLVLYQVDMHQSYVVLPYALLKQVPLLRVGRTPGRLGETTMFAVAILASYGVAALGRSLARRPRLPTVLVGLLLIGIGFEYVAVWPFPASSAEIPETIQRIADEPDRGALLHVLMKRRWVNHRALYYQTAAERPIVGGEVHRAVPEAQPWSDMLSGLAQPDEAAGDAVSRPELTERVAWLRHFDVDYAVFHHVPWRDDALHQTFVEALLGSPRYEDDTPSLFKKGHSGGTLAAFSIPTDAPAPKSSRLYAFSRQGWHPPEQDGDLWRRWMYDDGQLYLYSTRGEVGSLRFTVDSHLEFPVLEVYVGEQLLDSFVVGRRMTYTTRPFTLTQGMNVFRFRAPGGCPQILDVPRCWSDALLAPTENAQVPCDPEAVRTTCRTFAFDHVSFVAQENRIAGEGLDVNFGDRVRLRGWSTDRTVLQPGATLTVTLAWEATADLSDQYVVFVHLLSPDGTLVAQHDAPPVGSLPSSAAWPPGTTFGYPVTIEIPDSLPSGDYRLVVGVYRWPDLSRLLVLADVPGAEINVVQLESVRIVPSAH